MDEFVPAHYIRDFRDRLTPLYAATPERLCYIEYPGVGHFLTPELWLGAYQGVVAWFERWLVPEATTLNEAARTSSAPPVR